MKKLLITLIIFIITISYSQIYAYSRAFNLIIETMNLETQNVNGKYLNEDIYNAYSLLVYGNPLDGYSEQRWKDVGDGRWTKNGSSWNGNGIRGEYWVLGENFSGYAVHNHKFPADIEPPTDPTKWKYAVIKDARASWNVNDSNFDALTREYMLNANLSRNDITYDITALDIGLDKIKLDNYATWKTKGSLYTQRYDKNGKKWSANFMVEPMSANASLEGFAKFKDGTTYIVTPDNPTYMDINYGAKAINLTDFAIPEHVKKIESRLYVDDVLIDSAIKEKALDVEKDYSYILDYDEDNESKVIKITVESLIITKFTTDGPLIDIKEYYITINYQEAESGEEFGEESGEELFFEEEIIDNPYVENVTQNLTVEIDNHANYEDVLPPYIKDITVKKLSNNRKTNLQIAKSTGNLFVCAGQTIEISATVLYEPSRVSLEFAGDSSIVTFDETTKNFEWTEPRARKEKTFFGSLKNFEDLYKARNYLTTKSPINAEEKIFSISYIIPYETKQTLESWSTLRNKSQDAFSIDETKLFNKIRAPYGIVIKASNVNGVTTKTLKLDVFERWDALYNRDISQFVI